ncbi:MAG: isoprenylcysteine carboxylmethyltransferase family protein [Mariprofundus sp.]|nr:isoprenylcysteine carboxylmethyltransferase family protein [Mariprofundus sp.]
MKSRALLKNSLDSMIYLFIGPFTVVGTIPLLLMQLDTHRQLPHFTSALTHSIGYLCMNSAAILALWCSWLMHHKGFGSPIPSMPAQRLVTTFPYSMVRQPMMLSLLLVGIGEQLVTGSLLLLLWIPIAARAGVLFITTYEEPLLIARFGDTYQNYSDNVPRWLPELPSIR